MKTPPVVDEEEQEWASVMYEVLLAALRESAEQLAKLAKNADTSWNLLHEENVVQKRKRKEARQTSKKEAAGEEVGQSGDDDDDDDQSLLDHEDNLPGGPTWKQLLEAGMVSTDEVENYMQGNLHLVAYDDIMSLEE